MLDRERDMSSWGRGKRGSKKKWPKVCPVRESHVKMTKALQGAKFLAYGDQATPVPTKSQNGHYGTETTPHQGKDEVLRGTAL